MAKQICFFEKNFIDLDNEAATITASNTNDFAGYMRTRSLRNAWISNDSQDDDDEIQIDMDLADTFLIDRIMIADHNLKSYVIELYDFDSGIWTEIYSITDDAKSTSEISFEEFYGRRIRITILGTQVADSEKQINRILITRKIGQFEYWPKIENPIIDQGKVTRKVLSGKNAILRTVGAFQCRLAIEHWRNAADLALVEALYRQVQGFQVWLSGGDESKFYYAAEGYREKDIYLMGIANDWRPLLKNGIYINGMDVALDLIEVVR